MWEIAKLWMKGCKVIILDIPLLFEIKMDRWTNPVIVVNAVLTAYFFILGIVALS